MSEASRERALAHAIAHHGARASTTVVAPSTIVDTAEKFHNFIVDTPTDAAKGTAPAAKPAATAAAKPAATKPKPAAAKPKPAPVEEEAAAEEEPATEEAGEDAGGVSKEDVGNAIASLINSNLKKECGALLASYGAKSLSGIPAESYAEFVGKAEELLMNA